MKSEWLKLTIDKIIIDYNKYITKNNSQAGKRFRVEAMNIIRMLKQDRKTIQNLRYVREDYLLKYCYGFKERQKRVFEENKISGRKSYPLSLSEEALKRKKENIKSISPCKYEDNKSFDIF